MIIPFMKIIVVLFLIIALIGCTTLQPDSAKGREAVIVVGSAVWFVVVIGHFVWGVTLPQVSGEIR